MRKLLSNPGFAWVSGLASRTAPRQIDDARFTDEEILTVVRAGEAGMKLADLCEATGISVATYYEWKARYGGLSAQQLQAHRERTRARRRRLTMLACAVVVAAVGVGGLLVTRQSDAAAFVPQAVPNPVPAAASAVAAPATAAAVPVATTATAPGTASETTGPAKAAPGTPGTPGTRGTQEPTTTGSTGGTTAQSSSARSAPDTAPAPAEKIVADPNAYSVQVAAVPDLQQARVALEKLTAAGYPAHVTTRTVNRVEMYRVRVGPLETRASAEQVAARLKRDGYTSPWVTR